MCVAVGNGRVEHSLLRQLLLIMKRHRYHKRRIQGVCREYVGRERPHPKEAGRWATPRGPSALPASLLLGQSHRSTYEIDDFDTMS